MAKAQQRMFREFIAEAEALGLKANTKGWCNMRVGNDLLMEVETEPEPLKGNKAKVEAARAAGHLVHVFVPIGQQDRSRAFKIIEWRKVIVKDEDMEVQS